MVAVGEDVEPLQRVPRQVEAGEPFLGVVVVRVGHLHEPHAARAQRVDAGHDVVGAQRDVLHAGSVVVLDVLLDLALLAPVGRLVDRHHDLRAPSHTTVDISAEYSVEICSSSKCNSSEKPSTSL